MLYVDQTGTPITAESIEPNWSEWTCEYVTEDPQYTVIQHCRRFTADEKYERLLNQLEATKSDDIYAALRELAEEQAAYEDDVNAALIELYELITGGNQNG